MSTKSENSRNNEVLSYLKDSCLKHFTDNLIKFRYILCGVLFGLSLSATTEAHAVICQNTANTGGSNATDNGA